MARGAGRSRVGTVRRAARFFEAQPLGMNTFPPRSASSATSPRSVKWQRAPAATRDWPPQDVGLLTADLTRPPAARLDIGRSSCRERVCQYVSIPVDAVHLHKKN